MQEESHLSRWIGRREAFALVAGRCTGAEAQSLRYIRDEKLYSSVASNWDEFCTAYVGASRRSVERNIRLLEEFGPTYFDVAQVAHIGPEEYRAIAEHIGEDGIHLDDAIVRLLPENGAEAAAAVNELLRRTPHVVCQPEDQSFEPVLRRCQQAARMLAACPVHPGPLEKNALAEALVDLRKAASFHGVVVMGD